MYSKIKSFRIKNFKNIGDITIDFTKSPIVTLLGENESGKSSVIKAFAVLGANAYSAKHNKYVRNGTNGFGIACELEDGTVITRIRKPGYNGFTIQDKDGNLLSAPADKIDRGCGVPVDIEKYMGIILESETKELLQIRTYADQLLFVLTKGSENYKVMYNALKVKNITKAINIGNQKANEDKRIIANDEVAISTLNNAIKGIKIIDIDNAVKVKEIIKQKFALLEKLEKVKALIARNEEITKNLGAYAYLNETSELNESVAYKVNKLGQLISDIKDVSEKADRFKELSSTSEIDYSINSKLANLVDIVNNVRAKEVKSKAYIELANTSEIVCETDKFENIINRLSTLDRLNGTLGKYRKLLDKFTEIDDSKVITENNVIMYINKNKELQAEYDKYTEEANKNYEEIKNSGAIVTNCPNCGETVVVDPNLN